MHGIINQIRYKMRLNRTPHNDAVLQPLQPQPLQHLHPPQPLHIAAKQLHRPQQPIKKSGLKYKRLLKFVFIMQLR